MVGTINFVQSQFGAPVSMKIYHQLCFVLSKKLKLRLKNTIIDKTLTYASETGTLTMRDRKQLNIFERNVYRRVLGPVYDNDKENWRILTNKFI